MGEYYSDIEIDAILNNHALIQESLNEAIRYAKSIEGEFESIRREIAETKEKYESLHFYAKEMHAVMVNEIGPTRISDEFKSVFIDGKP